MRFHMGHALILPPLLSFILFLILWSNLEKSKRLHPFPNSNYLHLYAICSLKKKKEKTRWSPRRAVSPHSADVFRGIRSFSSCFFAKSPQISVGRERHLSILYQKVPVFAFEGEGGERERERERERECECEFCRAGKCESLHNIKFKRKKYCVADPFFFSRFFAFMLYLRNGLQWK